MVAIEQHFPEGQRIIDDNLAFRILPFGMKAIVALMRFSSVRDWMLRRLEKIVPGIWASLLCRKCYIDEKVVESVPDPCNAVVNLGAGLDTRPYRFPALAGVPVWEVEQPENIDIKRSRLKKVFGKVPEHVTLVPVDFDHQKLSTVMASHGYETGSRTFFIWEGVTSYLTREGIEATFDFLARAATGSRMAFSYIRKDFIDGSNIEGQEYIYDKMLVKDKIWLFGMDPDRVEDFLAPRGWRVLEHFGYEKLAEQYVKPTGRSLETMALERMVYADKR